MSYIEDFECYIDYDIFAGSNIHNSYRKKLDDFIWTDKEGNSKHIKDMETTHLISVRKFLERRDMTYQDIYKNILKELEKRVNETKIEGSKLKIHF